VIGRASQVSLAAAAVAASGAAGWFLLRRRGTGRPAAVRRDEREPAPQPREPWTCECGQEYLVAGRDRHRIYWPAGAGDGDPTLAGECRECGRSLAQAGRSTT